jgi:signal transduction histidine kinase
MHIWKWGKELDRLISTVRQMLDFYRLDSELREPCDIQEAGGSGSELLKVTVIQLFH